MALSPNIKQGDWKSVEQGMRVLNKRLGAKACPTFAAVSITGEASVSTLNATSAVISAASMVSAYTDSFVCLSATISAATVTSADINKLSSVSATVSGMSVTSLSGLADCIAVNSLPTGSNYQFVFHIPDVHFYVFG